MSKTILVAALAAIGGSFALGIGDAEARKYPTGCDPDLPPSMCDIFKKKKKGPKPSQQTSAGGGLTADAPGGMRRGTPPKPKKPNDFGTIYFPDYKPSPRPKS